MAAYSKQKFQAGNNDFVRPDSSQVATSYSRIVITLTFVSVAIRLEDPGGAGAFSLSSCFQRLAVGLAALIPLTIGALRGRAFQQH